MALSENSLFPRHSCHHHPLPRPQGAGSWPPPPLPTAACSSHAGGRRVGWSHARPSCPLLSRAWSGGCHHCCFHHRHRHGGCLCLPAREGRGHVLHFPLKSNEKFNPTNCASAIYHLSSPTQWTMNLAHLWPFVSQTDPHGFKKKQCSMGDLPGMWENCILRAP